MKKYRCIIIEDEVLCIDMMVDYVNRIPKLQLVGVLSELNEHADQCFMDMKPDIVFLDLILPESNCSDDLFDMLHSAKVIVLISAVPMANYQGSILQRYDYELLKPLSFDAFSSCINHILLYNFHD